MTDSLSDNMQNLPQAPEPLRALILATFADRNGAVTERDILLARMTGAVEADADAVRCQVRTPAGRTNAIGPDALEQATAKEEAEGEKQDLELRMDNAAKRRANRGALSAHLPRIEVTLEPEDTACPCCRAPMTVIGAPTHIVEHEGEIWAHDRNARPWYRRPEENDGA